MKKILIVEDEIDIINSLKLILKKKGFQVEAVLGGEKAIEKINSFDPQIILLDVLIPFFDGAEFIKDLKKKKKGIKVILVTAVSEQAEIINKIREVDNTIKIIRKPFKIEEVLSKVS